MELKSDRSQKKIINLVPRNGVDDICEKQDQWFFKNLHVDDMSSDYFDIAYSCDVDDYKEVLGWCAYILEDSPSAVPLLKEACDRGWSVTMEDLGGGDYCIDVDNKLLILNNNALMPSALARSPYFRNATLVTMTKALRDIWQEKRYGGFDELYSPEHVLLMERVRAADLDVVSILVAWELRSEEYSELWRHFIGSDLGDMAMAFSGHLERDPSAQFNGQGLLATFKQWFRDTRRVNACDHDTLEYLDDVLESCAATNPFGRKKPGKLNIEVLSCLPDRTAYLQGHGAEILSNPMYSAMTDEINQTHLFHIMYDMEAVIVENVPFRDEDLARKIFPADDV